ncbi:hypothetical protein CBR_g21899 [Chara braunii]|uniref:Uncharacterized protein n=1 Tax=Chara braunii TaxID=69332 RepID=A0A388L1I2_CHABU|nr:hypothetical protein CBR_g21899 [Chara braunii]|eukprot:GBG76151.1 hypothetical protein CBR_g21899 [Chara braunii]
MKQEQEKDKIKKEEEEKLLRWKKESEQLEDDMDGVARFEKRFKALGLSRNRRTDEAVFGGEASDELTKLRKENDELQRRSSELLGQSSGDKVHVLQKEVVELRKQATAKQSSDDAFFALQQEIGELKQSAYVKTNFEHEIAGLKKEIDCLREQNANVLAEANQWKNEVLRPGNKRGSVVIDTLATYERGTPKPRCSESLKEAGKWKGEYNNLRSLHRLTNIEAEALKKKIAKAEMKRLEAENQVKELEAQMSKLNAGGGRAKEGGGTNLKERL